MIRKYFTAAVRTVVADLSPKRFIRSESEEELGRSPSLRRVSEDIFLFEPLVPPPSPFLLLVLNSVGVADS